MNESLLTIRNIVKKYVNIKSNHNQGNILKELKKELPEDVNERLYSALLKRFDVDQFGILINHITVNSDTVYYPADSYEIAAFINGMKLS